MPRTVWTPQTPTRLDPLIEPTVLTPDVANGNSFANSARNVVMRIYNGNAGTITVTVDYPGEYEDNDNLPNVKEIATGEVRWMGPFPAAYNQTDASVASMVLVNFDISTDVEVELLKLTPA